VIWRERFKGTLHWGMAAKALAPLVQEHGTDLVQAHFREYLKRLDDVQYANLFKFRSAFGSFSPTPKGRPGESYRDRAGPSVSHRIRRLPVDR
jgi:hypothetical protein